MHFYPFNIGDYLSHTSHLTDAEDLAYRRMLDLYYQSEQPFENAERVARKIRSSTEIVQTILNEFFKQRDGLWHHTRADSEIAKYQSKADSARKANQMRWRSEKNLKSDADQILNKKQETINKKQETINNINTFPIDTSGEKPKAIHEFDHIDYGESRSI